MERKFIYVFGKEYRDVLLANEYKLLKSDTKNNIYVFENKSETKLSFEKIDYALSDTLTF
nr:MAG TPA: hypothetical protein [Caudoviricetes sp.]